MSSARCRARWRAKMSRCSPWCPAIPAVLAKLDGAEPVYDYRRSVRRPGARAGRQAAGLDLFVLDAPHLFDRPGNPYLGPDGRDWPTTRCVSRRWRGSAPISARARLPASRPTSCTPTTGRRRCAAYLITTAAGGRRRSHHPQSRLSGPFSRRVLARSGLPPQALSIDGVEYFGGVGFLKAGLQFADRITTVSPTYAREIMTPEFGMALDGLLRTRADVVEGIVNGIDDGLEPGDRCALAATYNALRIDMRSATRRRCSSAWASRPRSTGRCLASSRACRVRKGSTCCSPPCPSWSPRRTARGARLGRAGAGRRLRRRRARASRRGRLHLRL